MAKIIIKDSEISSSAGINIPGNLSIAGDTVIGDLFTDSLIINASTTFNEDINAEDVNISSSFKGDGSQLHSITASNISNFTNDVRAQFTAGANVTISNGVISSDGGVGSSPGGADTTVQFNSGSSFSGSTNLTYNYATNTLGGITAQFTNITVFSLTGSGDSSNIIISGSLSGMVASLTGSSNSTYTLTAADSGKVVVLSSSSEITLSVGSDLPVGFTTTIIQNGAGSIVVSGTSGVDIKNRQNHTKTAGLYAVATLIGTGSNGYIFAGDTMS